MRWEHQQIRQFLDAIALKLNQQDFATEEEEMGLEAVLCPHNQKEEDVLYPMIDQVVGTDERAEIFAAMDKTQMNSSHECPFETAVVLCDSAWNGSPENEDD
jgi:iron-sulfur cluster repair protein YtfE (RIC family)